MKTEALIIGGGIAGLGLAALLGTAGLPCTVVDTEKLQPVKDAVPSGRTVALMDGSVNILKAAGIWKDIEPHATPLKIMRLVDDSHPQMEKVQIDFHAEDIGLPAFGYNIPNAALRSILAQHVSKQKSVTYIAPAKLSDYEIVAGGIEATLDNSQEISARVIIGADGRKSSVRRIAGIDAKEKECGQIAITCLIEHSKPHHFVSTEHHRPGGPFTLVPMSGQHSSVVWVEKTEEAQHYLKLRRDDFERTLQEKTRGALGQIKLMSSPESWPLIMISAKELIAERVALVAEAAHVFSPIGAQGLNLSLRDVATIAEIIVDAARVGLDIGSATVLQSYAKRRRADVNSRVYGVDNFNRIVSNNVGFLRALRRGGLKTLEAMPALKEFAMHQGLAPTLDEGRLMKGEAL